MSGTWNIPTSPQHWNSSQSSISLCSQSLFLETQAYLDLTFQKLRLVQDLPYLSQPSNDWDFRREPPHLALKFKKKQNSEWFPLVVYPGQPLSLLLCKLNQGPWSFRGCALSHWGTSLHPGKSLSFYSSRVGWVWSFHRLQDLDKSHPQTLRHYSSILPLKNT